MPVTLYHANLFQDRKELYQFLLACKETLIEKNQTQIVSISLKTQPVDPLIVLHKIAEPTQMHFYVEKPNQGEAIAAIDAALKFTIEGNQRFAQAQEFINSCLANTIATGTLDLPFSGPHFFCSFPFFEEKHNSSYSGSASIVFLPRWQVSCLRDYCVIVANVVMDYQVNLEEISEKVWRTFQTIDRVKNKSINVLASDYKQTFKIQNSSTSHFKSSVVSALKAIQSKQFSKIVLAQAIDVSSPTPFHPVYSLSNLRRMHPDCYIFSTGNETGKTFIGASPERLIRIQNQELETDALAGSAPRGQTAAEDAYFANGLLRSEKEKHEHQVVSDFIVQRLSHLGLTPQRLPLPCLLQLSNIQHLWTPIRAKLPTSVHPLKIVAELHPTPAVAGDPRDIACQEIRRYETFDRSLYAAPLGWIDHRGNSEFIVGIRSALIDSDRARLFAGAGIVAGSDPDKEIAEIQLKLQALLKALI